MIAARRECQPALSADGPGSLCEIAQKRQLSSGELLLSRTGTTKRGVAVQDHLHALVEGVVAGERRGPGGIQGAA